MRPTADLLPVAAVEEDALRLAGGGLRAVLECPTLAFGLKSEAEQRAVIDGWTGLLNSLEHPVQVLIRTRAIESRDVTTGEDSGSLASLRRSYAELMAQLTSSRRLVSRRCFMVVPWEPSPGSIKGRLFGPRSDAASAVEGQLVLEQRVGWMRDSLRRIGLEPVQLSAAQLTSLYLETLCPETAASQPVSADDRFEDWAELVAPAALEERPSLIQVGTRLATVLAVSRYPTRLHPGWLASLQGFEGDLDISLHIHPSAGQAVMSFLGRRVAELGSTLRIEHDQGRRGDPYRRAALDDAQELQDRLARGEERLFDASLYLAVWADSSNELEANVRRLEALLGARMLQTRRLLFQMRPGLLSSLPLGNERVGIRRCLTTGALAATFPFAGNDLGEGEGVLYGINPDSRSPVLLDRFRLENHNSVVFATSGAGKSYLIKVELIRSCLAGVRAQVIDPEGEYTPIVQALGGAVVELRPGRKPALDPFAIPQGDPGALTTRIVTLLTLFELLAGGLTPNQRAAAEDAISFVYAARGFADDGRNDGLTPPGLDEIQSRLRLRSRGASAALRGELDQLVLRLDRYVSGAGRWLFEGGEAAAEGSVVAYALSGLPEEDRAAAMFIVLDQVWRGLGQEGPTLVVLDEAWWLMQYPDTARFLFRLAKTARKRRAGLALVTQDVTDVLDSPLGEPVVTNSALQVLMKQSPQALPRVAELFRLTPAEQSCLLNAQPGEGLLLAAGKRVPFQVIASQEETRLIERHRLGTVA